MLLENIAENSIILYDQRQQQWKLFSQPLHIVRTEQIDQVVPALGDIESAVKQDGLWAAGFLSYEAASAFDSALHTHAPSGFPLLWFGLYRRAEPFRLPEQLNDNNERLAWQASVSGNQYADAIRVIKHRISRGDTYQVNYTYRQRAAFQGKIWLLFQQMVDAQGPGYSAFVNLSDWCICSASPELFFSKDGTTLTCKPMKGTAARGLLMVQDQQRARRLERSVKDRAENTMIVDMVRNDMGRIARTGSVRVPQLNQVECYPTVWQMTSTVTCQTDACLPELFSALYPAASITGAPKASTMNIIIQLENTPRNIYTGSIGFISPENHCQFNVAIRTLLLNKKTGAAEYGTGGGIVWDSSDKKEYEESLIKTRILNRSTPRYLFESMLWTLKEGYFLPDYHLDRLSDSALYFGYPFDRAKAQALLKKESSNWQQKRLKVRLVLTPDGEMNIEAASLVPHPLPYPIRLAAAPVDSGNPNLYHKTSDRKPYQTAAEQAVTPDVILWNEKDRLTESCTANIALEISGTLYTPPVSDGLLPGVYRRYLLEQKKMRVKSLKKRDLTRCSKIYCMNSVRGLWEADLI